MNKIYLLMLMVASLCLSCAKQRLFTKTSPLEKAPSQVHFFNNFPFDSSINFSLNGLIRGQIKRFSFSSYFPSVNQFDKSQAGSLKAFVVSDPLITTRFSDSSFKILNPDTSYLCFVNYPSYLIDKTGISTKETVKPRIQVIPEDLSAPYPAYVKLRVINMLSGLTILTSPPYFYTYPAKVSLSITPFLGGGSTGKLIPNTRTPSVPNEPGFLSPVYSDYILSSPGAKTLSMTSNGITVLFQESQFESGKVYSLFAVGDPGNYSSSGEPFKLLKVEEGKPETLVELNPKLISRAGVLDSLSAVRVHATAFNVPDSTGAIFAGTGPLIFSLDNTNISNLSYGGWYADDAGVHAGYAKGIQTQRASGSYLKPGSYAAFLRLESTVGPSYTAPSTIELEKGKYYSIFLLPKLSGILCDLKTVENDVNVIPDKIKIRVANMLLGSGSVDVRLGSPNGKIILADIPFGHVGEYAQFDPGPEQLYFVTRRGVNGESTDFNVYDPGLYWDASSRIFPLFKSYFQLPLLSGNNVTLILSGASVKTQPPRGHVSTNPFYYKPIIELVTDAYFDPANRYFTPANAAPGAPVGISSRAFLLNLNDNVEQ